jgi:hypothetical protein
VPVVDELVNRHQLDRRDAEREEVIDHLGRGQGFIGAPELLRYFGV